MKKRSLVTSILAFSLLATFAARSEGAAQLPTIRIGMVIDGPWERNEEIRALFQREILELTRGEFDVSFPEEKTIESDWTLEGVRPALEGLLADPEVDLVLAMGAIASDTACRMGSLPKPVVAPFVIDAAAQGLPQRDGASGVGNLSYLTSTTTLSRELAVFREISPFDHLTILSTFGLYEAIPELRESSETILSEMGIEADVVRVATSADEALEALAPETEAVYVFPLLRLAPGEMDRLIAGLIERRLPSFSRFGRAEVERGILASLSEEYFPRRARRVALHVQRILLGEDAGTLPVEYTEREQLVINMATARAIHVYPSFALITVAELINQARTEVERTISLREAAEEAVTRNLDLAAAQRMVAAGAGDVRIAWSHLLPQLEVLGRGVFIDKDRAEASFGSQGQRTFTPSLSVTQPLFSEPLSANLRIQRDVQDSRRLDRERLRLDVAHDAVTAYMNVLRTKTLERIQTNYLEVTRSNLELARVRETIGASGPAEVFRWEAQIANDRRAVIAANSRRNLAEIALNRLLHRPLEEPFLTEEVGLEDPFLVHVQEECSPYLSNQWNFSVFRDFLVEEGLAASPELQALDAFIAAQERKLLSARRAFFAPQVFLQGEVSQRIKGGAGADFSLDIPFPMSFPIANDMDWNIGVQAELPLFTSGYRPAVRDRDIEELARLRLERRATAERIEQRIRSALHVAGASLAAIRLAADGAEASRRSLELVTDAYSRGAVSILELLDAQNAAFVAEAAAANSVHDFVIDFVEVQRAIGTLYILGTPEERGQWLDRADQFFRERGSEPPQR